MAAAQLQLCVMRGAWLSDMVLTMTGCTIGSTERNRKHFFCTYCALCSCVCAHAVDRCVVHLALPIASLLVSLPPYLPFILPSFPLGNRNSGWTLRGPLQGDPPPPPNSPHLAVNCVLMYCLFFFFPSPHCLRPRALSKLLKHCIV